jgi:antitoxin component of RelBE/YafQ-DinJ toxin-antitoxin module
LGFNLSDGINVFLKQVVVDRALPFQPHLDKVDDFKCEKEKR